MKNNDMPLEHDTCKELLETVPAGLVIYDEYGRITWVNQEMERLMGRKASRIVGLTSDSLPMVPSEHQTGEGTLYHLPDAAEGKPQWVMQTDASFVQKEGEIEISFYLDVSDFEEARVQIDRLHQALRGQVATDNATGLPTRKATLAQLESQVSRSRRYHNSLAIILMRIQCEGGATKKPGQPLLLAMGNLLRDQTRWPDIIGRWDEQTFLLVLPETSKKSGEKLTRKISEQISIDDRVNVLFDGNCKVIFGVAEWCKGDNANELVNNAIDNLIENLA